MAELRLEIPDEYIEQIRKKLGTDAKLTDIGRDALTVYNWAVTEKAKGNLITASDQKLKPLKELSEASLDRIKPSLA